MEQINHSPTREWLDSLETGTPVYYVVNRRGFISHPYIAKIVRRTKTLIVAQSKALINEIKVKAETGEDQSGNCIVPYEDIKVKRLHAQWRAMNAITRIGEYLIATSQKAQHGDSKSLEEISTIEETLSPVWEKLVAIVMKGLSQDG